MLETGGRRSKVEGLRWSNVNLSWSTLSKDGDIGSVIFADTKNGDDVVVPIAGSALDRLRALWQDGGRRIDTDLVFPREDGAKPVHTRRAFDKALELARVNEGADDPRSWRQH